MLLEAALLINELSLVFVNAWYAVEPLMVATFTIFGAAILCYPFKKIYPPKTIAMAIALPVVAPADAAQTGATPAPWAVKTYPDVLIEQAVISDCIETVTFNRANNGESSSFLEFGLHSYFHSHVHFVDSFETETKILKDIMCKYDIPYNFVNLDIQGVELKALKGMGDYLKDVQYIYTEVNSDYVYKNCSIVGEIDDFLKQYGFSRVETSWFRDCRWGDAFYMKSK